MIGNIIIILAFAAAAFSIIESILLGSWASFYFRSGIIIFEKEFLLPYPIKPDLEKLEAEFSRSRITPLLFRMIGANEYAFREKLFHFNFFSIHYTPIMHGLLFTNRSAIKVIGKLNWFALIFSVAFIVIMLLVLFTQTPDEGQDIFRFVPFVMFGIGIITMSVIYATQAYRYKKVGEYLIKTSQQSEIS